MTEDPVKLYVVVMAILVGVLGFVANTSYKQASAFEQAIAEAPQEAEKFREISASVTGLINQLKRSKLTGLLSRLLIAASNSPARKVAFETRLSTCRMSIWIPTRRSCS